jgi:hypothetical protein
MELWCQSNFGKSNLGQVKLKQTKAR